ncbi:MAG: YchF/TatD family DNA exonuclease [Deltaproteobacteria bacterium]|nr:MAG: YchF/TatD family DNA exonuclease [Deltaproteobacteria bacterium]
MEGFLFDSHTHLDIPPLSDDPDAVVQRARESGVGWMVTIGIDLESCRENIRFAERYDGVFAAVGIHPHNADEADDGAMEDLKELAGHPRVVAVGETGLDFYRNYADRSAQEEAFRRHIRLAKEVGKPLIIHDREAHGRVMEILQEEGPPERGVLFHCFSGSLDFAKRLIDMGFYLSIPGVVTYRNAKKIVQVVENVTIDRLLIETDAPYLTPEPHRGKPNEPALIVHTAERIAQLKGLSLKDVGRVTATNAFLFFGIQERFETKLAYEIRNSLYLNVTNRCTNRCVFCSKRKDFFVKGHYLKLDREPTVEEILEAAGDVTPYDEVVFCGFGEPTLRLEEIKTLARILRERGARKIRLNTDGLANLVHGRNVVPELAGVIDSVSVSLNAPDAATYARLCPNPYGEASFQFLLDFVRESRKHFREVQVTVVDLPGLDVEACRRLAEELGVPLRVREYNEVG